MDRLKTGRPGGNGRPQSCSAPADDKHIARENFFLIQ
jgi:hypothetical protein